MIQQPIPPPDADTIGYRRVSKREQAKEGKTSLADQTAAITAQAALLGRVLSPSLIFEDQTSGEDVDGRPGFRALVAFCRAHPRTRSSPGYVLFLNDSRFGRFVNPDENAYWRFQLAEKGWEVRFAENDASDDKTARHVMRSIGGAQATEYRDNLRRNAKRGAVSAANDGLWQNEAPVGYRRLATAPGRAPVVLEIGQRKSDDQQVRLTLGPDEEQTAVLAAFEGYAEGRLSLGQLVPEMRRRVPRLKWSKSYVGRMLTNPAYLGHVVWCRRPHDKTERAECPVRPETEWVGKRDAHPPLVPQALFDAVQARLRSNRKERRATPGGYPLSGLIRCAFCGEPYVGGGGPKNHRDPSDPDRYRFYRDRGGSPDRPLCPGRLGTLQKRIVEPAVVDAIADAVSHPGVQELIRNEIDRYLACARGNGAGEQRKLKRVLARLDRERSNLVSAIARGTITAGDAEAEMDRIRAETTSASAAVCALDALRAGSDDMERERERLVALATDFTARVKAAEGHAVRGILEPWIERAVFDKESGHLTLSIRRVPLTAGVNLPFEFGTQQHVLEMPAKRRSARGRRPVSGDALLDGEFLQQSE